jgi:hypothetical protein
MKMKVTVEMDDDAFDLIMVRALEEHIRYCYGDVYYLEEDVEWNEKLKQALWVVFEYFAGEEAAKDLKNSTEDKYDDGEEDEN